MANKHQVIAENRANPAATVNQIARKIGCHPAYVRATAQRNRLVIPPEPKSSTYRLSQALTSILAYVTSDPSPKRAVVAQMAEAALTSQPSDQGAA